MNQVSFVETTSDQLNTSLKDKFVDGRFIFTTDTGNLYRETKDARFMVSSTIDAAVKVVDSTLVINSAAPAEEAP